jgi:hypothetical protein
MTKTTVYKTKMPFLTVGLEKTDQQKPQNIPAKIQVIDFLTVGDLFGT